MIQSFRVQGFRVFWVFRVLEVQGLGYGIWSLGLQGLGFSGLGFTVLGLAIQGLGFRIRGFRVQGLGFKGFRIQVQGLGFRVQGLGFLVFRVQGLVFGVWTWAIILLIVLQFRLNHVLNCFFFLLYIGQYKTINHDLPFSLQGLILKLKLSLSLITL